MAETGTKKKQFKFRKIVNNNNNSLPAQTPVWLPSRPTPKIENFPENSPGDFDCSLTDYNFFTINSRVITLLSILRVITLCARLCQCLTQCLWEKF